MNPYRKEIFPVSIYHGTLEDNNRIKKNLVPYIEKSKNEDGNWKPPDRWMTNKLITSFDNNDVHRDLFNNEKDSWTSDLRNQYLKLIGNFFEAGEWKIDCEQLWYNYYSNGEWQEQHRHLGDWRDLTHFAFVHFVQFDHKRHVPITFVDPLECERSLSPELDPPELDGRSTLGKYRPKVREGDCIMFPSWLEHEVRPGRPTPDYPRISMAMNIKILQMGEDRYRDKSSDPEMHDD
tara:strand:- start:2153 stop:2857 length:705 start_codon:yes stop_codon:yes gene_type:complete